MSGVITFTPFKCIGGDLYQRIGTPAGLQWRHISRSMAWGHVIDLLGEAETANGLGDTIHAKRLARDANCLLGAIGDHDNWLRCAASPANQNTRSEYA